jgi:YidC/Oxa1 family membrane protein insertase
LHVLVASWLDPFVAFLWWILQEIDHVVHNLGWSLILLAALIRAVFWGLNVKQFKAMLSMQRIAPRIKALQERYKGDQQRIQQETMALYREAGVNPLAGCLPMIVQLPVLYSVYWVIALNDTIKDKMCAGTTPPAWFASFPLHAQLHAMCFDSQHFLWVGTALARHYPLIFGASLAAPDVLLLALYAGSMYFSMRYGSVPSTDEQQAQMQRVMAIFSPLLLAYFGWRAKWPSAMILYWFSYNAFTMAQQVYMLRRYHQPLSILDSEHVATADGERKALAAGDGAAKQAAATSGPAAGDGEAVGEAPASARRRRRRRKRKK